MLDCLVRVWFMMGCLLRTLYNCALFIRHFILRNLRSFHHPRAFLFEYILNVHRPTDDTVENIHSIFDLFHVYTTDVEPERPENFETNERPFPTSIRSQALNQNVLRILSQCPEEEDILQVFDGDGYNLLQKAIIINDVQLVHALLRKCCDINKGTCSPPLHLACKLGNVAIVKLLLKHGAHTDKEAGMCYPKPHACVNQAHSKFFFIDKNVYDCESNKKRPVLYAVDNDNVELVKVICGSDGKRTFSHKRLLHYACSRGAYECIDYFYGRQPQDINRADENGYTPFLHGIQWGHRYANSLLNKGASIYSSTPNWETALHVYFAKSRATESLYETTKLLLGSGLEDRVNAQDVNGNTALHNLVFMIKQKLFYNYPLDSQRDVAFHEQALQCIDLLLRYNSDPSLCNKEGVTPVHVLLTAFYEKFNPSTESDSIRISEAFDLLYDILEVFLANGMNPDIPSPGGRTPLMILLPHALHIDYSAERVCCKNKFRCLQLLCGHGADPNFAMATDGSCVSLLSQFAAQVIRMRFHAITDVLRETKQANAAHLQDILVILLKNGLNVNYTSNRRRPQMEPGSGNGLVEFVKLAQNVTEPKDFALIHSWILTMLQWGANPDIQPFPSESIICQAQSSIFLKHNCTQAVNHYMLEIQGFSSWLEGGHAEDLLMLFVNSMDHVALYQCLGSTKFMSRFNPNHKPSRKFNSMVRMLNTNPRSLKQISRVAILKAMDRKVVGRVDTLPLPRLLKEYVSELRSF